MRTDDWFEQELPAALRAAGAEFGGPSPDLVDRVIRVSRRRRRVRRLIGSTVAGVLVLVLGGIGGLGLPDDVFPASTTGQGPAARPTGSVTGLPSPGELVPYVRAALPDGGRTDRFVPDRAQFASKHMVTGIYAGTDGSSALLVEVSRPQIGSVEDLWQGAYCEPATTAAQPLPCLRTPEPDGGALTVRGTRSRAPLDLLARAVVYTRPDGVQLSAETRALSKAPEAARAVLGTDALTALVRDPVWNGLVVDRSDVHEPTLDALRDALPPDVRVRSLGAAPGFVGAPGRFTVMLGDGSWSTLTVSVRSTSALAPTRCPSDANPHYCGDFRLPNGDLGVVHQTFTPDGRVEARSLLAVRPGRLAITCEVRAGRGPDSAPQGEPGLSVWQLALVATGANWTS